MADLFRYEPAPDESVDAQYVLIEDENWTVQVCSFGGGFAVNEHGQTDPDDPSTFWMREHGVYRTRAAAMSVCLGKARAAKAGAA